MAKQYVVVAGACVCAPQREILKAGDVKPEEFFSAEQIGDLVSRGFIKEVEGEAADGNASTETKMTEPPAGENKEPVAGDPPKDPKAGEGNPPAGDDEAAKAATELAKLQELTKKELESMLTEKNIEFKPNSNKDTLIALLTAK